MILGRTYRGPCVCQSGTILSLLQELQASRPAGRKGSEAHVDSINRCSLKNFFRRGRPAMLGAVDAKVRA